LFGFASLLGYGDGDFADRADESGFFVALRPLLLIINGLNRLRRMDLQGVCMKMGTFDLDVPLA
jgi:hypothetical protein